MIDTAARWRTGDPVRIRGERWAVQQQSALGDVVALDVRGIDPTNAGQRVRYLLPFEPVESIGHTRTPKVVRPPEWRRVVSAALAGATAWPDSLRAAPRAELGIMPFQLEPVLAVTGGRGCRLLIADDVGLGKTVQAGLIVAEVLERNPNGHALVVCPAGLRGQWQEELQRRFGLAAIVLDATGVARAASWYDASSNPWSAAPLVVTSIDFIKQAEVMRALEGLVWDVVVFDEAHNLAARSDRSMAAAALAWRSRTVVMLSATPHSGDAAAFARLTSLGDINSRFPLLFFRRSRSEAGLRIQRRTRWLHVRPTPAETRMHLALCAYARRVWRERPAGDGGRLAMTVLLRRAASSADSLTRSLERRLSALLTGGGDTTGQLVLPMFSAEPDEEPLEVIRARGLADAAEERRVLGELVTIARAAALRESKLTALTRWLRRVREPVLIFTEYRDTLTHLRSTLSRDVTGYRILELHGGLTRSERRTAESLFTNGDADILLATDAASEGLNLHHRCRCVVNLEVPWTPVRLEQRIGRVDRIGQRRAVHALQLVASGTFELTTLQRLVGRAAIAADALHDTTPSPESTASAILTGDELPLPASVPTPPTLVRVNLTTRAAEAAQEVFASRRLWKGSGRQPHRAVATLLAGNDARTVCGFEITLRDALDMAVWSTVVGIDRCDDRSCRTLTPRQLRNALDTSLGDLARLAEVVADRLRPRVLEGLQAAVTLNTDREQAIARGLRLRHARIAADLLQPGLFDRRTERLATSQSLILEEALGRCHFRLESLARLHQLRTSSPVLRFAVFFR